MEAAILLSLASRRGQEHKVLPCAHISETQEELSSIHQFRGSGIARGRGNHASILQSCQIYFRDRGTGNQGISISPIYLSGTPHPLTEPGYGVGD